MREKWQFSNGQDVTTLNSTGVVSENTFNIEQDVTADQQIMGWINGIILASDNSSGTEGMFIEVRTDDNAALDLAHDTGDENIIGAIHLRKAEIVAGTKFSIGVCKANLGTQLGLWFRAHTTSLNGNTTIDAWFSEQPMSELGIQKKPA